MDTWGRTKYEACPPSTRTAGKPLACEKDERRPSPFLRFTRSPILRYSVLFVLISAFVFVSPAQARNLGRVIYEKNSLYQRIFVFQNGSVVALRFGRRDGNVTQSVVDLRDMRRHLQEYSRLAFCGLLYNPEPKKILVLGLGGGVIPREMHYYFPDAEVDVAEIDPEIPKVARRFFRFREDDRLRVHIADGRVFVRRLLRAKPVPKYDMVILDAFNSDYIPFHLMTREFLEEVRGVLAEDGVVVANVFHSNRLFDAELKTFLAVFGRCQVFFGIHSTNAMLVSLAPVHSELTAKRAAERARILQKKHRFTFDLRKVAARLRLHIRPAARVEVLTDDRAPVNWLRRQGTGTR